MANNKNKKIPIKPVVLGKIGSCYGIYGWLRVFSSTESVENIFKYQPWFIQKNNSWQKIVLEKWCFVSKSIILKIKGIDNRNSASLLVNRKIVIDSSQLPQLEDDLYYWKDIINCRVITTEGFDLGQVINMIETGSNDVLVIKKNLNDISNVKIRLVPFLYKSVVKKVDLTLGTIVVDWDPYF